jgi:hypothetical protein
MKRAVLAGAIAMAVALPTGWATAKVARQTPAARPKASVARFHKDVKVGKTKASAHTRKTKASARKPKGKTRNATKTQAKTSSGSTTGVGNPAVGALRAGSIQRRNGHSRLRLGGNAGGTPIRTGLGL